MAKEKGIQKKNNESRSIVEQIHQQKNENEIIEDRLIIDRNIIEDQIQEKKEKCFTQNYPRYILLIEATKVGNEPGFKEFQKIQDNVFVSYDTHNPCVIEDMLFRVLGHRNFVLSDTSGCGSNFL